MPDFSLPPEVALLQETSRAFASLELRPNERGAEASEAPLDERTP